MSSGLRLVSSIQRNSASDTAAMTDRRTMNGEPNQSSLLPSSSTVCSDARPIASVAMPGQSPWRSSPSFIGAGFSDGHSVASMIAPGTRLT